MSSKIPRNRRELGGSDDGIESLYHELLRAFYELEDRPRSREVADRLAEKLAASPTIAKSIFGEEIRSLLAELDGDLDEAIRSREGEVRKILELQSMSRGTPGWSYVARKYNDADLSDRLDLLAMLYAEQGDLSRAITILKESENYCRSHEIPFDGKDLLEEYERQLQDVAASHAPRSTPSGESIDEAIRVAYLVVGASADAILVDDALALRFVREVHRLLEGKERLPDKDIKKRLLNLRRRGQAHEGLPRLRDGSEGTSARHPG